jgi:hypothetical protein
MNFTFRQLGELALKLIKNGDIRASYDIDGDDWGNVMIMASNDLIRRGKLAKQAVSSQAPKPILIDIKGDTATLPSNISASSVDSLQIVDGGGKLLCDAVSKIASSQASMVCNMPFKYFYVSDNEVTLINTPSNATKIKVFQSGGSDLDSIVSSDIAYMIFTEAIKLGKQTEDGAQDNTVDGNSLKETINAQLRAMQNSPNNII